MEALKSNDLEKIKRLSDKEVDKNIIISPSKELEITGIKQVGSAQLGNKTMFKFYVTRTKEGEPKADLEQYYLEVRKTEEGEYKVSELKSTELYSVFLDKDKLKIRKDDDVEINTLIDLKSIPDKIYPKVNVIDVAKVDVPKEAFSAVEISFSGDKVAISTYKGEDSYIGVVDVEDAQETASKEGEDEGGKEDEKNDDKTLGKNGTRFKVYQSGGSIVSLELDDIFAEEEYNLIYERIQDNNIIMNVTPIIKSNNTESGLIGRYKISLKDFKLEKL